MSLADDSSDCGGISAETQSVVSSHLITVREHINVGFNSVRDVNGGYSWHHIGLLNKSRKQLVSLFDNAFSDDDLGFHLN